jgi:linoleoyl-CoA desaturase
MTGPGRPASPGSDPAPVPAAAAAESLAVLRRAFQARGWDRPATARILAELCVHGAVMAAGLWVVLAADATAWRAAGLLVFTYGSMGVACNTHTASHGAAHPSPAVNRLLLWLGYPFLHGLSATWWRHKHLRLHHAAPNVVGMDADIDLMPYFALTEPEAARGSAMRRAYYRHQWLVLLPALGFAAWQMHAWGLAHVLSCLASDKRRRREHWLDAAGLALHIALWVALPLALFPAESVAAFLAARWVLFSYTMFAVFAPAHLVPFAATVEDRPGSDFVLLQTATTIDFSAGRLGRFLCAGLDHQIEHHLFPGLSHVYYARMRPEVEAFCRAHGYPYRRPSWGAALLGVFRTFRTPKPVVRDLRALTRPAPAGP